jgi:U11/U12 small nuclear ribonucleoprotein SNRNP65
MDEANNLLVRHLPACLTFEEKEDLLKHFGATDVTVMGSRGKLRNCAFATFNDSVATGKAREC